MSIVHELGYWIRSGMVRRRGPRQGPRLGLEWLETRCVLSGDVILEWNAVALDALKNDYAVGQTPEQGGPTKDSRALAIVHAAMFDAVNSIDGSFTPYLTLAPDATGASIDAAAAQAAHDTLVHLYPGQAPVFDAALADTLNGIPNGSAESKGVAVGRFVASAILDARAGDGSDAADDHHAIGKPGHHQPDPLHPDQGYLSPKWGEVTPFAVPDMKAFLAPAPPALGSPEYAEAFAEVATLGGDGVSTPTLRTEEQTIIGIFWGYDGSPGLGTPPRLYNQIARAVAGQQHNTVPENARLFALVNLAMADAGIQAWDTKYVYDFWRPVVAVRAANADGNPLTERDAGWAPLGAPRSNAPGETNFTPNFPAYTSGHATFGAALFRTLANFYGRDDIAFSVTSDEFNGVTRDQNGEVREKVTRTFGSFSDAAEENGQSRIYLGIHWSFDKVEGIRAGNAIADHVFGNLLRPQGRGHGHASFADAGGSVAAAISLGGDEGKLPAEAPARWQLAGTEGSPSADLGVPLDDPGEAGRSWLLAPTPGGDPGEPEEEGADFLTALAHELAHLPGQESAGDGALVEEVAETI